MFNKIIYTAFIYFLFIFTIYSQSYVVQVKTVDSKKWGYANIDGEIIIEPKFKKCFEFSKEGFAAVQHPATERYLFIDLHGNIMSTELIDFTLKSTFVSDDLRFESGLIPICQGGFKYGYLDTNGKIAIPIKCDYVSCFNNGFAAVKRNGRFFIINTEGVAYNVNDPTVDDIKKFSEGLAPFKGKKRLSGFIGTDGKIAIPAQYDGVGYFKSGLAWARTKKGLIGYINKKGEWVIEPQFAEVRNFDPQSGLAKVRDKYYWSYVDKEGNMIGLTNCDWFDDYSEGMAGAKVGKTYGFINTKQEWTIKPQFEAIRDFKNGYAAAKLNGGWGIINKKGEWAIEPVYLGIKDVVKIDDKL